MKQNSILQITQMAIMAQRFTFSTNSTWLHTDSDTDYDLQALI